MGNHAYCETALIFEQTGADVFLRQAAETILNRTITTPTISNSLTTKNYQLKAK